MLGKLAEQSRPGGVSFTSRSNEHLAETGQWCTKGAWLDTGAAASAKHLEQDYALAESPFTREVHHQRQLVESARQPRRSIVNSIIMVA
jgi:hypothetical protein